MSRIERINKVLNSQKENLDYRYDVKAYKEYLKEWLKHKDEPEYLRNGVLSFAEFWEYDIDYEFEDYKKILKLIDEYNKNQEKITNGGPGSGNHNPGQGRGIGKPTDGHAGSSENQYSAKNYLSKKEFENIVDYVNEDNFTEEEFDSIASYAKSMGYGSSCDLNQAIKKNENNDEIVERKEILYPADDEIVTWKENREFLENKIKEKEAYDKLYEETSKFRSEHWGDPNFREEITKRNEALDKASNKLNYDFYKPFIERYTNGDYKDLDDNVKMWAVDENKLKRVSILDLRKEQQSSPDKFYEKINTPRLSGSSYYKESLTTDTLATLYGNNFKNLDKLDRIIKNKGYALDKDITVTRRVANIGVIKNQIQNKGQYTQNGITSTTAAKSIVKKMPSGVHMGDDLIRITIPKGTRVISTYKPFEKDIYKKADEYQEGKLYDDDYKNMKMLRNQNELILPSGSKFVSPGGNKLTQNEDGSYQLILKVENDKMSKNSLNIIDYLRNNLSAKSYFRSQRLYSILNKVNRGNPYHDKFGRFSSGSSSSSSYYYDSDTALGDKTKSGDITKEIKSFRDFKDKLGEVTETYNSYDIKGQEVWVHPDSKLFKKIESPVTDENSLKARKNEIEKENKSPFVLVSTYNNKDVIIDGNHVAAAYRELSEEGKNYLVPVLYVKKEEIERFEKEHPDYHSKEKTYTKTKLINE